ncbi:hypothetical protein [Coleofasciculus sp. F4-SAH-05]|uniref:hypothetical protein n=1 Tax=Coleofasciculus sp. F4-SAH-05 TaxID=3069525 RepID=UPI0033021036
MNSRLLIGMVMLGFRLPTNRRGERSHSIPKYYNHAIALSPFNLTQTRLNSLPSTSPKRDRILSFQPKLNYDRAIFLVSFYHKEIYTPIASMGKH